MVNIHTHIETSLAKPFLGFALTFHTSDAAAHWKVPTEGIWRATCSTHPVSQVYFQFRWSQGYEEPGRLPGNWVERFWSRLVPGRPPQENTVPGFTSLRNGAECEETLIPS